MLHFVVAAALLAQPTPEQIETAELLNELLPNANVDPDDPIEAEASALSSVRLLEADGGGWWPVNGLHIEAGVLVVPLDQLEQSVKGLARFECCEPVPIKGIVAYDAESRLALVAVDAPDAGVYPAPVGDKLPEPGSEVEYRSNLPISIESFVGNVINQYTVLSVREWPGRGVLLRLDGDTSLFPDGAVVTGDEGNVVAIATGWAGSARTFAAPLAPLLSMPRTEPVSLEQFSARERDDFEEAARLEFDASMMRKGGDLDGAIEAAKRAVELDPRRWYAWFTLGVAYDETGHPNDALRCPAQSIVVEPNWSESRYSVGLVYLKRDDYHNAIKAFRKALEIEEHIEAEAMLGVALLYNGESDEAIPHMRNAVRRDPDRLSYYINLDSALTQAGRDDELADLWRGLTEADPDEPEGWFRLGTALFDREAPAEALPAFDHATELGYDDPQLPIYRAICLGMTGHTRDALAVLDAAGQETRQLPIFAGLREFLAKEAAKEE